MDMNTGINIEKILASALREAENSKEDSYLEIDIETQIGGVINVKLADEMEADLIEYAIFRVNNCGKTKMTIETQKGVRIITLRCRKQYCPRCGGNYGFIHKQRFEAVKGKLGSLNNNFIRHYVFTIPESLVERFKSRGMLNKFISLVKRLIKKYYGVVMRSIKTRKGTKKKYSLNKKTIASLELFGSSGQFLPHIHVLIIESRTRNNKRLVSPIQLARMRNSYRRALEKLLCERVDVVDIHYSYHG